MRDLIVVGCGGHGVVVAECATAAGMCKKLYFLDDRYPKVSRVNGVEVIGIISSAPKYANEGTLFAVGIGDNALRLELFQKLSSHGASFAPVIHPSAVISCSAIIGSGTVILANAVINARVEIGVACIISTAATVDHDSRIDSGAHLSPGCHLAGGVTVGKRSWIGIGAVVVPSKKVGDDVVVGAGAAVISDVPYGSTVVGVPALPVKSRVERSTPA